MLQDIKDVCTALVKSYYLKGKAELSSELRAKLKSYIGVGLEDGGLRAEGSVEDETHFRLIIQTSGSYIEINQPKEESSYCFNFHTYAKFLDLLNCLGEKVNYQIGHTEAVATIGECLEQWQAGSRGAQCVYGILEARGLMRWKWFYREAEGVEYWVFHVGEGKYELSLGKRVMCTYTESDVSTVWPTLVANKQDFILNFG